ncbi:unnamed protein product [Cunninghamella blakesleeana]
MFKSFKPVTINQINNTLPTIGKDIVTVEKCIYYLSLVEQFSNLRQTFKDDLDTFHARAEMRYEYWIDGLKKKIPPSYVAPPIDVAYIWHAHLVSPFRYYEDSIRLDFPLVSMPLSALHEQYDNPSASSTDYWKSCAPGEPFQLTEYNVFDEIVMKSPCNSCGSPFKIQGVDMGRWRFNPDNYIKCCECQVINNMHHKALYHLIEDTTKNHRMIRGTTIGFVDTARIADVQNVSFVKAKYSIEDENQSRKKSSILAHRFHIIPTQTDSMDEFESLQLHKLFDDQEYVKKYGHHKLEELIRIIRLTYSDTNPSPFSLDLLQAVERQFVVSTRMLNNVRWLLPDSIVRGMRNYVQFLTLMKENNQLIAVPTLEIDVSWHTHQLHPLEYRQFTLRYIKRVINHDDTIPQITLDKYSLDTRKAWDKLFSNSNDSENNSIHSDETETSTKKSNRLSSFFSKPKKSKPTNFEDDYNPGTIKVEERIY